MTVLLVVSHLMLSGCSLAGSAGIAANLRFESGLNPAMVGHSGVGLPSWAGVRRTRMIAALGVGWRRDGIGQLDYLLTELRGYILWDAVCGATDPARAASVFMRRFERPRATNPTARERVARAIYEKLI